MSNYKEASVSGAKWQRCRQVTIDNNFGQTPQVYFKEEEIVVVGDQEAGRRDVGMCTAAFDPANGTIPLVNPITGVSLGTTASHADLYVILHSLYLQVAAARDAELAAEQGGGA